METKTCTKCKQKKEITYFVKTKSRKGGYGPHCKLCHSEAGRKRGEQPCYYAWSNVKNRCRLETYEYYQYYGGRGITFDETFETYKTFIETYGEMIKEAEKKYKTKKLEIDRINNDGNYEFGNIRFVPRVINQNNRSDNRYVEYKGETKSVTMWYRELNPPVSYATLVHRLANGWPMDLAIRKYDPANAASLTQYFKHK